MDSILTQRWLTSGTMAFEHKLQSIRQAAQSIRLETYIYQAGSLGDVFRDALTDAVRRGVKVQVMIDALGSQSLPWDYWSEFIRLGGSFRLFNPLELRRLPIRNHRKLIVCDGQTAIIGGFNIAAEYQGDGIESGWRDIGVLLRGPIVAALEQSFDHLFDRAGERPKRFAGIRKVIHPPAIEASPGCQLLLGIPGRGSGAIQSALHKDLARAKSVRIIVPYFLPGARLRRAIQRVARRRGRVELIVPGRTDVAVSKLAAQSFYTRLLRSGVQLFEYRPQILHAKLFIIDDIVYVGSSNLDTRSLHLNHELLVRLETPEALAVATAYFEESRHHSSVVDRDTWARSRSIWTRLRERWCWFLLARIDPWVARWLTQP